MTTLSRIADSLFAPFSQKTLSCAMVVLLATGCTPKSATTFEARSFDGIIGGELVTKAHPVSTTTALLYNADLKENICTVTLISTQYAVTAAHCIEIAREESFRLVFGPKSHPQNPVRAVLNARALKTREGRQAELRNAFDIALIKFAGGLPPGFQPATLMPQKFERFFKTGIPVAIAGYGINNLVDGPIDTLRLTTVFISNPTFSPTEILMDQTKGRGACKGDSGGPAYFLVGGKFYFWGVASRGVNRTGELVDDCAQQVVYTNALLFLPGLKALYE